MRSRSVVGAAVAAIAVVTTIGSGAAPAQAGTPSVLLVGPAGTAGAQYTSIQAAVNAAHAGDWVLIAPGVYHEKGTGAATDRSADVLVTTGGIHIRGMNRDTVIIDGTNVSAAQTAGTLLAGSAACSSDPAQQDRGVPISGGTRPRQGLEVYKVSGVSIENLSVCNSLGNEIWWNQGDGGGVEAPMTILGDYLTATSTFYKDAGTASAQYGIFTSNEMGPGLIDHSYANNMTDSSYYIGACRQCNMVLNHPHAENSALGLSSTNAGGTLIIENGEWDLNRTGLVSNAQNNDDFPSPEYGQCVAPSAPPAGAGPNSCFVIRGNRIHDNNNPNTPGTGLTAVSATGTGIELVATQHVSVIGNVISNNGSWGVITHDFPDPESGPANCNGGVDVAAVPNVSPETCTFFSLGNTVADNTFNNNGFFNTAPGGPGADIANEATGAQKAPSDSVGSAPDPNCYSGNTGTGGALTADPPTLQTAPCSTANADSTLAASLVCATGAGSLLVPGFPACPGGLASYPQRDGKCTAPAVLTPAGDTTNGVCFLPAAYTLSAAVSPPMPDPCAGVPVNAYCPQATPAPVTGTTTTPAPNTARSASVAAAGIGSLALAGLLVATRRRRRHSA